MKHASAHWLLRAATGAVALLAGALPMADLAAATKISPASQDYPYYKHEQTGASRADWSSAGQRSSTPVATTQAAPQRSVAGPTRSASAPATSSSAPVATRSAFPTATSVSAQRDATAAATAQSRTSGETARFTSNLYNVTKEVVSESMVGGEFVYRIRVDALQNITNIEVFETLPVNVRFASSTPEAQLEGDRLYWSYPSMNAGESRSFEITIIPTREGAFETCTVVTVDPMLCLPMYAGSPVVELAKSGPSEIELGETGLFRLTVSNTGSAPATNVVVTDQLPNGLTAVGETTFNIPTLGPGQSRTFDVRARADRKGNYVNLASTNFDGGAEVLAERPVTVVQSSIALTKAGPERKYVFNPAQYDITVTNTGDTTLTSVQVTDELPEDAVLIDAGGGTANRNRVTWSIPSMAPGTSQTFNVTYTANNPNTRTGRATVTTSRGLTAQDEVTTRWIGAPGMTIELSDSVDPIRVGERTVYTIKITNQGTFEPVATEVRLILSPEVTPINTSGVAGGTISGQEVSWPIIDVAPRRSVEFEITVRGARSGIGKARLEYKPGFLLEPYVKEESTYVY